MEQGRISGANMAGQERIYSGTVPSHSLKVAGLDLLAAGEIDPEGKMESAVVRDEARMIYRKLVLSENRIVGAMLLGDTRGKEEIRKAIQSKKDISSLKKELAAAKSDFSRLK
jgi:nitrite reductase (NADH) large subunit